MPIGRREWIVSNAMVEMRRRLRDEAQVVIIGGGIVACSVTEEIDGMPPKFTYRAR